MGGAPHFQRLAGAENFSVCYSLVCSPVNQQWSGVSRPCGRLHDDLERLLEVGSLF